MKDDRQESHDESLIQIVPTNEKASSETTQATTKSEIVQSNDNSRLEDKDSL